MAGNQQGNIATVVLEEVIEIVAEMMAAGNKKFAIKRFIEEKIFTRKISINSYEAIRSRARKLLQARAQTTLEEHRASSLEFYRSIASDGSMHSGARLRAMENMDDIFGLKVHETQQTSAEERASQIRQTLREAEQSIGAEDELELSVT